MMAWKTSVLGKVTGGRGLAGGAVGQATLASNNRST
jgi:hypothetical protein